MLAHFPTFCSKPFSCSGGQNCHSLNHHTRNLVLNLALNQSIAPRLALQGKYGRPSKIGRRGKKKKFFSSFATRAKSSFFPPSSTDTAPHFFFFLRRMMEELVFLHFIQSRGQASKASKRNSRNRGQGQQEEEEEEEGFPPTSCSLATVPFFFWGGDHLEEHGRDNVKYHVLNGVLPTLYPKITKEKIFPIQSNPTRSLTEGERSTGGEDRCKVRKAIWV